MILARVQYRRDVREEQNRYTRVKRRLEYLIKKVDETIYKLEEQRAPRTIVYNYVILKHILEDVYNYISSGVKVDTKTTYIFPGALWLVKSLINGRRSINYAAFCIGKTRYLARKMFKTLVTEKNLTFIVPSNLSLSDIKVYMWADKAGYDYEGNPLYVLTMYFSFPFDLNELDRRSEYEPVSFLFVKKNGKFIPLKAFARIHYDLYVYDVSKMKNIKIMFMRIGHTPKILSSELIRLSSSNIAKELADKAWILIGDFVTRITGTYEIRVKDSPKIIHVYVYYKLPPVKNNPFTSLVHPYFSKVSIP